MMAAPTLDDISPEAIEILGKTSDGDELTPTHLKLVEMAVNGHLNPAGLEAFADLLTSVRAGYKKPWLHDIEHLSIDTTGFVYWKGRQIEHFGLRFADSERGKQQSTELARRCCLLEARGETPDTDTVIWNWSETPSGDRNG